MQKYDKSQSCISWLPSCVLLTSSTMVNPSNMKRVDMVMLYGVADGNAKLARELWTKRFPNHAIPCVWTLTSVVQHLRDHGTFKSQTHDRGRGRTERIQQAEEQILERVEEEPDISPTCSWSWSFTVCSASCIKRTRPTSTPRSKSASLWARFSGPPFVSTTNNLSHWL